MKAMILAAGAGTRMQQLTENTPKALLKVGKYCLIEHQLFRLKNAGIEECMKECMQQNMARATAIDIIEADCARGCLAGTGDEQTGQPTLQ